MNFTIAHVGADFASRIQAHLQRLAPSDRVLRFVSAAVSDQTVGGYVASIRYDHDTVAALMDDAGTVVGFAHGRRYQVLGTTNVEAALSVDAAVRGRGLGNALMRAVMQHARDTGVTMVVAACAARNLPMRRIFEREDMAIDREGGELYAHRVLGRMNEACRRAGLAPEPQMQPG